MAIKMNLIPAIDIRNGLCVRLKQGDPEKQTVYAMTPLEMAKNYFRAGVRQIHLVDLDGAFSGKSENVDAICEICRNVPVKIELGGGIRTLNDIEFWLKAGVHQVILGTIALEDPSLVRNALNIFGHDKIIVGVDVRDGNAASHGWKSVSSRSAITFGKSMVEIGVKRFIFTDIGTDGMFTGPNLEALTAFAEAVRMPVTASGGISCLNDLIRLVNLNSDLIDGVIIGRAIYENRINVSEALRVLEEKT